jgi:hypothetical protein
MNKLNGGLIEQLRLLTNLVSLPRQVGRLDAQRPQWVGSLNGQWPWRRRQPRRAGSLEVGFYSCSICLSEY